MGARRAARLSYKLDSDRADTRAASFSCYSQPDSPPGPSRTIRRLRLAIRVVAVTDPVLVVVVHAAHGGDAGVPRVARSREGRRTAAALPAKQAKLETARDDVFRRVCASRDLVPGAVLRQVPLAK